MVRVLQFAVVSVAVTSIAAQQHLDAIVLNRLTHSQPGQWSQLGCLGHLECVYGGPRNIRCLDFKAAGLKSGFQHIKLLYEKDSDGIDFQMN